MTSKFDSLKTELASLIDQGELLWFSMAKAVGQLPPKMEKEMEKKGTKLPHFDLEYDTWYSEALRVVKQIIPDRTEDFIKQYKDDKRKNIDRATYVISDYLLGLKIERWSEIAVDRSAAVLKMQRQNSILKSAEKRFDSALFDIQEIMQAELFDSELETARELAKKGFFRPGGAVAGVVLEKHLGHACQSHGLKSRKSHPSIADFNDLLKEAGAIDTPKWRFIQHLGDLRNLCDHNKDREPTKDDVLELVEGVEKVIKTVA